jgi:D-alanine transaminase
MLVYLNGQFVPDKAATISVLDRGFIFGDGVYEVWRVVRGRLFESQRHLRRLQRGLNDVRITTPPLADADEVARVADRLLRENDLLGGEATLYVEITRGTAPRSHAFPPEGTAPTVFAMAKAFAPPSEEHSKGIHAITTPDVRWMRCNIKTVQLLPNVLAQQKAVEQGAAEAVLIRDGVVTEGSHSNVFGVLDGELRTHVQDDFVLPGITREVVLEIARAGGIPVREEALRATDLERVSELFLTGTTTDVMPIIQVDSRPIGSGRPGPIAQQLYAGLRERLDA